MGTHSMQERLPVRVGCGRETLPERMTYSQAKTWGIRNIPADLKKAGFVVSVFRSDPVINDGDFFRVNYSK